MDDSITITLDEEDLLAALGETLQEEYGTVDDVDEQDDDAGYMTLAEFDEKLVEINDRIDNLSCSGDPSIPYYRPSSLEGGSRCILFEFKTEPTSEDLSVISDVLDARVGKQDMMDVDGDPHYNTETEYIVFVKL